MIARVLISQSYSVLTSFIEQDLKKNNLKRNHPDLLYLEQGTKLGINEAKKIREYFSLKPYAAQGRMVVLEDASEMTTEAQNALLKTIEELPKEAMLILGASSSANFLPTVLSRCEVVNLEAQSNNTLEYHRKYIKDLERLLDASAEDRFEYIEKLKDKEKFLRTIVYFFHQKIIDPTTHARSGPAKLKVIDFLKELLRSEEWAKQNVNIRAILEYLMLVMPRGK